MLIIYEEIIHIWVGFDDFERLSQFLCDAIEVAWFREKP